MAKHRSGLFSHCPLLAAHGSTAHQDRERASQQVIPQRQLIATRRVFTLTCLSTTPSRRICEISSNMKPVHEAKVGDRSYTRKRKSRFCPLMEPIALSYNTHLLEAGHSITMNHIFYIIVFCMCVGPYGGIMYIRPDVLLLCVYEFEAYLRAKNPILLG